MATAPTFSPWFDSSRASFMRSQFASVTVMPPAKPITVELIAPETGIAQMSLPIAVTDGAIAVGGGWPL
jgi:hypothetical protein